MKRLVPLALLVLVAASPVVAGWVLYFNPQWLPNSRGNRGTLVEPPVPVSRAELVAPDGTSLPPSTFTGRWTLLLMAPDCEQPACRRRLWDARQVRLALGEGRERVERLLLLRAPPSPALRRLLADEYPDMRVARCADGPCRGLLPAAGARAAVIDPMGRLVLRYAADAPAKDLLADLEHLLRLSEHWGTHARN